MKSEKLIYNALNFPAQGNDIGFIPIKTEASLHIMRGINDSCLANHRVTKLTIN